MGITCAPERSRAFPRLMKSVSKFANEAAGMVLGVCNGFSRFCWRRAYYPGAMTRNSGLRFICRHVHIRVEQTDTPFTNAAAKGGQVLENSDRA